MFHITDILILWTPESPGGIADCACRAMSLHIEAVQNWKDKHIRIMHLTAGLLIFAIGLAVIFEWI